MMDGTSEKISLLFSDGPKVINLGLEEFAQNLKARNEKVIHVRWQPPAMGNADLLSLLDKLK